MIVSNGATAVERMNSPVRLVKNGGYIDVHLGGKWLYGIPIRALAQAVALTDQGAAVNAYAEHDRPVKL